MDLQQLTLKILGDSSGAESALDRVNKSTVNLGSIVKSIIAGAAVAAMVKWTETTIDLGVKMDEAGTLMGATMQHILGSTNEQIEACKAWAENQEKVNHFDATDLMAQMDKAIVKYGDLGTAQLAVNAAEEVSRLKGVDLSSAYGMVEQASNGMARSLKEFGITAVAGTSQLTYLKEITDKVSGSTDAYNKTTAGMKANLATTYEMMREQLGQALLPTINALTTGMVPVVQKIADFVTAHKDDIAAMVQKISDKISDLCDWLANLNLESVFTWLGRIAGTAGMLLVVGSITSLIAKVGELGVALTALSLNPAFLVLAAGAGLVAGGAAVLKWGQSQGVANARNTVGQILGITPVNGAIDMSVANPQYGTVAPPIGGNRTLMRGAAPDASDVSKGIAAIGEVKKAYTDAAVAAVDMGSTSAAATKTASTAASDAAKKVADAAKAAADAIQQSRQAISDKIYTLTHTDQQNEQRALDQEYQANLLSSKDKIASQTLYTDECTALTKKYADIAKTAEEEQTAKLKTEVDARIAEQQRYQDAVESATKSLMDQITAATESDAQKQASAIAMQLATAQASGVSSTVINQASTALTKGMYTDAMAQLTAASTLAPGQTSFTSAQAAEIARLQGVVAQLQAAQQQYLSAPSIVKAVTDIGVSIVAAVTRVAPGVARGINGMAIP